MTKDVFNIHRPRAGLEPLLISSPHSGTEIPSAIADQMTNEGRASLDTDHFVDELYAFGPDLGMTQITARYSRYVIDLNRDPEGAALYHDGRHMTALVPVSTFQRQSIYLQTPPDEGEVAHRRRKYFDPYHTALAAELAALRKKFGVAVLWDCHSIKRYVPSISSEPFPDVILGNQDGKTCRAAMLAAAERVMREAGWDVGVNAPFKGGFITRHFGRPDQGVHAIQLEMSQDLYMDETNSQRDPHKQANVQAVLRDVLKAVLGEANQ